MSLTILKDGMPICNVCNVCGGPFGACTCHIKNAPKDECPLTTDEIRIPTAGEAPFHAQLVDETNRRAETQDLTVRLDQIRDRERVA